MTTTAVAAERTIDHQASTLVVATGQGDVRVRIGETMRVQLKGEKTDLEKIQVDKSQATLCLFRPLSEQAVINGNHVNIAIGDGAVSTVVIGNKNLSDQAPTSRAIDVKATVPPGTIIHLEGMTGHTMVGNTGADLVISCVGCTAKLGELAALRAVLTGDGRVDAVSIERRLEASVTGNGQVMIAGGNIDMAEIAIVGDGQVALQGRSEQASVKIVGQGQARFGELTQEPTTMIVGNGQIMVGQ